MDYIIDYITEEQKNLDNEKKADRRTADLLVKIANSIDPSIVMEASVPSDFQNGKMPLLNCQVWIEKTECGEQIRYEHFEKPVSSILEIQSETAMPEKMKRASLVQGGITRLLNTSLELGEEKQSEVLSKYMKKLQSSGYDHKTRLEILKSIMKGWKRILEKAESGERPLHRDRNYQKDERKEEKEKKKLNWYKGKDGKSFDSVMMVPATPNGTLKRIIEEKAKESNLRVKVVERSGQKFGSYLKKFDKTKTKGPCEENDC